MPPSKQDTENACFYVTKHSTWKGKYKRLLIVNSAGITTINPTSQEVTNKWEYGDIVDVQPASSNKTEFTLLYKKDKKNDSLRFSCDHRAALLSKALAYKHLFVDKQRDSLRYQSYKHHWSDTRLPVLLEVTSVALNQLDITTHTILASYSYSDIQAFSQVKDRPDGFVIVCSEFSRMHMFSCDETSKLKNKMLEFANSLGAVITVLKEPVTFLEFTTQRLGKFSGDEHITSVCEFAVQKITPRHPDPVRRTLCLSETCLLERDPQTYSVCTLRPLSDVGCIVRDKADPQRFSICYVTGQRRTYTAADRDSLLATLVDSVRGAGNRDVHVEMCVTCPERRWAPQDAQVDQEVESLHLKFLSARPPSLLLPEAIARFNANVPYSGLLHSVSQDGLFTESKEKMITNALLALAAEEFDNSKPSAMELEAHFQALRRLYASKAGFSAFIVAPGLREATGKQVMSALRSGDEGVIYAAIDMMCALIHPMHCDPDLRQEQCNKTSVISNKGFMEKLLDMWMVHINRGTAALVVSAMLDLLTFILCVPYCETTEGKDFDAVLELVATRGRALFRLFQHSSLAVVKGAGFVMRAIVEEGEPTQAERMQVLSLSEGALPRHLHTALYTPPTDSRQLALRQLSRHLVGLWVADGTPSMELLKRILPSGLVSFLDSVEAVPESVLAAERLASRNNLQMATELGEGSKRSPQWQAVERQLKVVEKHVEDVLLHWGARIGVSPTITAKATARDREKERKERPVVLRRRRERVKATKNWALFYYKFNLDHAKPDLLWNHKTRGELREAVEGQIRQFQAARELSGNTLVAWNHGEFEVVYKSLDKEIKIGEYYLRLLLEKDENNETAIERSHDFFNQLYHALLLSAKTELKCQCLQAMTLVYGRHHKDLGSFSDTKYIVAMLDRSTEKSERDRLVLFLDRLVLNISNAKAVIDSSGVRLLVDLLTLAHLHTSRAVVPAQSNVIEGGPSCAEELKEWHYQVENKGQGPEGVQTLRKMLEEGKITARTRCWAAGMDNWKALQAISQLRWTLLARGPAVLDESALAARALDVLRSICEFYPSRDQDQAVVRPVPRVKAQLSDPGQLPHLVQLLLTFDPVLVEKAASLLSSVMMDNPRMSTLYMTGVFYFILMYNGSNVLPIARFLSLTHMQQAVRNEDASASEIVQRSVLSPLLPEAMLHVLENHGPEKFAQTFLGEWDTPEVIWSREMRLMLIQKLAVHVAEFTPTLKANNRALYKYCPIPAIRYPQLEQELFCNMYYLRHLCDTARFPDWPIREPIKLLKDVLDTWRKEVEKKPAAMSVDDAYQNLGLARGQSHDDTKIRKAYYALAQQFHPDKNPEGGERFEQVSEAYKFLCSRRCWTGDGPDPNNIVLVLRTQSILFSRNSEELSEYKYAGYPQLVRTIQMEVADDQLFSKTAPLLPAAAELAYHTVHCSALNAEELRREKGLDALQDAFSRCVSTLSRASRPDDVAVQVCMHVVRCFAVAARFKGCRDKMLEMPQLVRDVCRILHFQNLTKLCSAATECVAALATDSILQMKMLQAGVLWHMLLFMLQYDYTLEEGGVERSEDANQQEVCNKLAMKAAVACARLGGYLAGELTSPCNELARKNLGTLLTPYLAQQLADEAPQQMLKQLNSNCRSPYLLWDNGTRAELVEYLRGRVESREEDSEGFVCELVYSAHADEPRVGDIYLRIFCDQPDFPLVNPKGVVLDLLNDLRTNLEAVGRCLSESPAVSHAALVLTTLHHVLQANPGVEIQCIGYFPVLFKLVSTRWPEVAAGALRCIFYAVRSHECLSDAASGDLMGLFLPLLHVLPNEVMLTLDTLYTLLSSPKIVKEAALKGLVIHVLYVFACGSESAIRTRAAEVLARAGQDKLEGPRVRLALVRLLPALLVDAMRDAPHSAVRLFDTATENPELVWDDQARERVRGLISQLATEFLRSQQRDPTLSWHVPDDRLQEVSSTAHSPVGSDAVVAGVHLKLFLQNPGWAVRKPKEFLVELLDSCQSQMARDSPNTEQLELTTDALVALLNAQPALSGLVPSLGHLPALLNSLGLVSSHAVPRCALLILHQLVRNETCVSAMAQWECVMPLRKAMANRRDVIGIACDTLDRLFSNGSHQMVKQALDADLVPFLLELLDKRLEVENPAMARAQMVKALQSMAKNALYGGRVSELLAKYPVWSEFNGQKHDLFISNTPTAGYLTGVPNVAGYLTEGTTPLPEAPPPVDRDEPPLPPLL